MSWVTKYGQKRARNKRLIQRYLDDAELTGPKIAKLAGVTRQSVSATLNGYIHSEAVLKVLREAGVPEDLLCDPRKAQTPEPVAEQAPEQATA